MVQRTQRAGFLAEGRGQLEDDDATARPRLRGQVDARETALAEQAQQPEPADLLAQVRPERLIQHLDMRFEKLVGRDHFADNRMIRLETGTKGGNVRTLPRLTGQVIFLQGQVRDGAFQVPQFGIAPQGRQGIGLHFAAGPGPGDPANQEPGRGGKGKH